MEVVKLMEVRNIHSDINPGNNYIKIKVRKIQSMQPQRQRPLQNSMILPQTSNNLNKRLSNNIEYNFPIPNIKKIQNPINAQSHFQQHNLMVPQQHRQQFQQFTTLDQINQFNRQNNDTALHQIYQKLDKLTRAVDKHEFQLSSLTIEGEFSKRVMAEVKKNLPAFTGGNDVYEHIFNLKLDIKGIHEEIAKIPKASEIDVAIKKQVQAFQKKLDGSVASTTSLSGSGVSKSGQIDPNISELLRKRDQFLQNILTNLETQISIVKKNLSNINLQMKVSPIVSNSCIILKYQELFKARNKSQNDILLSENTYYIDSEGFLLDCHSRYIVDQKGKKIKLEDKHINMLKSQKILQ